ncbi:conserved membrane hypothetical protein [uncultured delta proteobacterium]|uniref:Tripartite ATP-independent periplasmic transporters DctQ component domain-containing protein n=1 Tax=uncultured delta proteobacterium TaxID=34034 RepID=A0A212JDC3_9DELT|nr:conserved membrane hypothetical protein [uncultured delta proteobacterium]
MVDKVLGSLSRGIEFLCAIFFVVMGASLTLQIFSRYCMDQSVFWAEEMARYSMVWLVYLGVVVAASERAHTRIEFFVGLFPTGVYKAIKVLVNIACLLFLGGITYHSVNLMKLGMMMKSSGMQIYMIYVYVALPVGAVLTSVYLVWEIFYILKKGKDQTVTEEFEV